MASANVRPVDIILEKRSGGEHDPERLEAFLTGYLQGDVPDYQVAAWLMAVCWQGMTDRETTALTRILAASGDELDLGALRHTVDKHSTGGVGDKTSLVLAPLLAAAGATVAKMSGRALGHTGGTVDKLESIPGFRSTLDQDTFLRQAQEVGIVVAGQSKALAPADGLLYSLRDATGTVRSLPLIASSIMSKKLAGGARSIVLDVKVGSGAFMRTPSEARALAETMIAIGRQAGRNMRAVLSSMAQPLGMAVGNALEVREALACLRGEGPSDLLELCLVLAGQVLEATGLPTPEAQLRALVEGGQALERFHRWIAAQGGDLAAFERLELAPDRTPVRAREGGVLAEVDALSVGQAAFVLGAGRSRKGDPVDPGVGVTLHAKVGNAVGSGEVLATLYHRGGKGVEEAMRLMERALRVAESAPATPLILETALA
ncbi:MAG TPA: thymidine phosphorylase [Trueperaceae bacterium]|nr:thymidine phosphorylase [Trueperaceae bacterium]